MAVPTVLWNENTPAGSDLRKDGDDRIREMKKQVREIIAIDHLMPESGDNAATGMHKAIHLVTQTSPTTDAAHGFIFQKDAGGGHLELYWKGADGGESRLTNDGRLIPQPDVTGNCGVTNGDFTVTYTSGTAWTTGATPTPVTAGSLFYVSGDPRAYVVASVTADISLELTETYKGTTNAAAAYTITPAWGPKVSAILDLHRDATGLKAHTTGFMIVSGYYTGTGAATLAVVNANGNTTKLTGINLNYTNSKWMIRIDSRVAGGGKHFIKYAANGVNSYCQGEKYDADMIISGDADGFTIGATKDINKDGWVFDFLIIKEADGTAP